MEITRVYFEPESMKLADNRKEYLLRGHMRGGNLLPAEKNEFSHKHHVNVTDDMELRTLIHFPLNKDGIHTARLKDKGVKGWIEVQMQENAKLVMDISVLTSQQELVASFLHATVVAPTIQVDYMPEEVKLLSDVVNRNVAIPNEITARMQRLDKEVFGEKQKKNPLKKDRKNLTNKGKEAGVELGL